MEETELEYQFCLTTKAVLHDLEIPTAHPILYTSSNLTEQLQIMPLGPLSSKPVLLRAVYGPMPVYKLFATNVQWDKDKNWV